MKKIFLLWMLLCSPNLFSEVLTGLDRVFKDPYVHELKNKNIGLVTHQAAISLGGKSAFELFYESQSEVGFKLVAAFAPEHGVKAKLFASEHVQDEKINQIPVYSLHGNTKRPTDEMLEKVDLLVFDLQSVGVRCYTYETTLTYVLEKAAEKKIPVILLDRPNPRGGIVVEGGNIKEKYRCFFSYNNIPFCHGMTMGELALYLNQEENIKSDLKVIPMSGWERSMTYTDTKLPWKAPSPNIPDGETALVYPATILVGETLEIVSVDLRGDKPFKRFGAPWLEGQELASILNQRNLPGVIFYTENFTPKWGKFKSKLCGGVLLRVTSPKLFQPLLTQYAILEDLRLTYPDEFEKELQSALRRGREKTCDYITGNTLLSSLINDPNRSIISQMKWHEEFFIQDFIKIREKYLLY